MAPRDFARLRDVAEAGPRAKGQGMERAAALSRVRPFIR